MTTIVLALLCAQAAPATPQANQADAIVTLRRKAFTWSFARIPERRTKRPDDGRDLDIPAQLFAAWTPLDPKAATMVQNPFTQPSESLIIDFYKPGKSYVEEMDDAQLAAQTQTDLSDLAKALLERFFEFDLDFPGGTWEDLARMIQERLAAAYAQQLPEPVKAHLPARIDVEISSRPEFQVRYPACMAKSITLAQLHGFGMAPLVDVRQESIPRVVRDKDGNVSVDMSTLPVLGQWILSDGHQVSADPLDIAFFNLGERPGLPRPEDVVALFEMAWKAHGRPVFARVKYHPETKSIMLQAKAEEIEQAQKAFATLTGRPAPPTVSANPFDNVNETLKRIAELIEKQGEKGKDK